MDLVVRCPEQVAYRLEPLFEVRFRVGDRPVGVVPGEAAKLVFQFRQAERPRPDTADGEPCFSDVAIVSHDRRRGVDRRPVEALDPFERPAPARWQLWDLDSREQLRWFEGGFVRADEEVVEGHLPRAASAFNG